jgi:hypothetical protein
MNISDNNFFQLLCKKAIKKAATRMQLPTEIINSKNFIS